MPRGVKQEAAAQVPGEAGSKEANTVKAKAVVPGVNKPPLKKQEAKKELQKAATVGAVGTAEGGIDLLELVNKRKELSEQLRKCELQIHRLESQYFETANPQGNALKGYDGLLSSTAVNAKKARFGSDDRIFSGSSTSGSAVAGGG